MPKPRYHVRAVQGREGDNVSGTWLGDAETIAAAFAHVADVIEREQGPSGKNLLYIIRDEETGACWTIIEPVL